MTYEDVGLFNLIDNGHEDTVDCFKKQVLEFYQTAVFELKQLPFNDPIVASLSALNPLKQSTNCCRMFTTLADIFQTCWVKIKGADCMRNYEGMMSGNLQFT